MRFSRLLFVFALVLSTGRLSAVVTLDGSIGSLFTSDGITQVPLGSLVLLVADTEGDGLADPFGTILSVENYFGGSSNDLIVGVYSASNLLDSIVGVNFGSTTLAYNGSFGVGDDLWLVWFPSVFVSGSEVGAGVSFGTYRSDVIDPDSGSNIAFVAPGDGTFSLSAYTQSTGFGSIPDTALSATSITGGGSPIPEPSTYAGFAGLTALLAACWVRRKR